MVIGGEVYPPTWMSFVNVCAACELGIDASWGTHWTLLLLLSEVGLHGEGRYGRIRVRWRGGIGRKNILESLGGLFQACLSFKLALAE